MKKEKAMWLAVSAAAVVIAGVGFGGYRYNILNQEKLFLEQKIVGLEEALNKASSINSELQAKISFQEQTVSDYENSLGKIQSTVETLNKWQSLDPELLEKYSKVFFLSENYVPALLSEVDKAYLYDTAKPLLFQAEVMPFLKALLRDASNSGTPLEIVSAFRSFGNQESLKTSYKVTYGSGANAFSADQGYSEHQLGTAIDFTTPDLKANFTRFDSTNAYKWLTANAYKYGFILSYPKDNSYYVFEPWHWRFVGIALATKLHNEGKHFYDLEQREIDSYLINIFNQSALNN